MFGCPPGRRCPRSWPPPPDQDHEAARRQPLLLQWGVARPALVNWLWRRRPRRSFYSARRGHEDDGGEGSESPRRGSIFSLRRSSHLSFCPKFHFYFCQWQWNLVLHHFVLISMQQHVNRARAPKHVMRVEIYWEKKYRKGFLSIKRSARKIKNIMIVKILEFWVKTFA